MNDCPNPTLPLASTNGFPLVVDLDGTLTPTDTLVENAINLIKYRPLTLLSVPFWLMKGRAFFKSRIAERAYLTIGTLPLRQELVDFLTLEKARGRELMLATAAHRMIAEPFAARLNLFDTVLSSNDQVNLKGETKLRAIQEHYPDGFVYAGDSSADLPVWASARGAILAGASKRVSAKVHSAHVVEKEFLNSSAGLLVWIKALRVHQWAKNLLLLIPMLTGFEFFDLRGLAIVATAILAFCLAASATYLVNDLWDLESDRSHPRKRYRPFACASIGISKGIGVAGLLLSAAGLLAAQISLQFVGILALYLVLTSAYSWSLKRYVLIDVIMLSVLYTLRIIAGSIALNLPTSSWLLAFSVFIFLSLALVKRCSELVSLETIGQRAAHGRDYRASDLVVLWPLGCAASIAAIVVFGLFISAPETKLRYASNELLWLAAIGLIYWQARLWIKTSRGEMHDDPLVFAIRDTGSLLTVACIMAVMVVSYFVKLF